MQEHLLQMSVAIGQRNTVFKHNKAICFNAVKQEAIKTWTRTCIIKEAFVLIK